MHCARDGISNMTFADDFQPIAGQWNYTGPGFVDVFIVKSNG